MRILITGVSGFVGTNLVEQLSKKHEIYGIDKVDADNLTKSYLSKFVKTDLSCKNVGKTLKQYFLEIGIDYFDAIIHCASIVPVTRSSMRKFLRNNIMCTYNVLSIPTDYLIHISSSSVYADTLNLYKDEILDLDSPTIPIEPYGASKAISELVLFQHFYNRYDNWCIIRPRTIFGRSRRGVMDFIIERIVKNKTVYLIGDGNNKMQFLWLGDMIDFISKLLKTRPSFKIFDLGTDRYTTFKNDLEMAIAEYGSKSKVITLPKITKSVLSYLDKINLSPITKWHYEIIDKTFCVDTTLAKLYGFKPTLSNSEMILECCRYYSDLIGNTPHTKPLNKKIFKFI